MNRNGSTPQLKWALRWASSRIRASRSSSGKSHRVRRTAPCGSHDTYTGSAAPRLFLCSVSIIARGECTESLQTTESIQREQVEAMRREGDSVPKKSFKMGSIHRGKSHGWEPPL